MRKSGNCFFISSKKICTFAGANCAVKYVCIMDKNTFSKLMDHPGVVSPEQWEELRQERDRYPFSAPLQVLSLLADKTNGVALWEKQSLPRVSLYFRDIQRLNEQLEAVSRPSVRPAVQVPAEPIAPPAAAIAQPTAPPPAQPAPAPTPKVDEGPFDILQAINSYQEVSFKTAPKSVILTNFLEKDGGIKLSDDGFEDVPVQELAKKSIRANDSLESETLALVLEKQGKLAQALAMYEKLMVNNPEKSSTFAVRISALKERLNEEIK